MPDPREYPTIQSLRDVPPDTLIPYSAVEHLLVGTTKRAFEIGVKKGKVGKVRGVRMTHKAPMHFPAGDLAEYIAQRMSVLEQAQ